MIKYSLSFLYPVGIRFTRPPRLKAKPMAGRSNPCALGLINQAPTKPRFIEKIHLGAIITDRWIIQFNGEGG